jgi:hypothetical protein
MLYSLLLYLVPAIDAGSGETTPCRHSVRVYAGSWI